MHVNFAFLPGKCCNTACAGLWRRTGQDRRACFPSQTANREALKAIRQREQDADIPVIALTAYALENEREQFIADGFDGYVAKPLEVETLVAEITRVIG